MSSQYHYHHNCGTYNNEKQVHVLRPITTNKCVKSIINGIATLYIPNIENKSHIAEQ